MKTVCKRSIPPAALSDFAGKNPHASWDDAHNDNSNNGNTVPQICCTAAGEDQFGLCAYCELPLSGNHPRVEHFHPKSDKTGNHTFRWENMLAVCDGNSSSKESTRPRSARLHCDAHKNAQIVAKKLQESCAGYILNPLELPPQHNLFAIDLRTGEFRANAEACDQCAISDNNYPSKQELVEKTIEHLNLNAKRLCELRLTTLIFLNQQKKHIQKLARSTEERDKRLCERIFAKPWRELFTTYRCILGAAAEKHLLSINYQG